MAMTTSITLKGIEFRQTEAGSETRFVVTFTAGTPIGSAEIEIPISYRSVPDTELVKEARERAHRILTQLAEDTKTWAAPPS